MALQNEAAASKPKDGHVVIENLVEAQYLVEAPGHLKVPCGQEGTNQLRRGGHVVHPIPATTQPPCVAQRRENTRAEQPPDSHCIHGRSAPEERKPHWLRLAGTLGTPGNRARHLPVATGTCPIGSKHVRHQNSVDLHSVDVCINQYDAAKADVPKGRTGQGDIRVMGALQVNVVKMCCPEINIGKPGASQGYICVLQR
jgi:hypothetical protein